MPDLEVSGSLIAVEMTTICNPEDWQCDLLQKRAQWQELLASRALPGLGFPNKTAPAVLHPYPHPHQRGYIAEMAEMVS